MYLLKRSLRVFNNLNLAKKLTVLLLLIFIEGIALSGIALAGVLNYKTQDEISSSAWLLLQTINSVRSYTTTEIVPQLQSRLDNNEFIQQAIPAYSSRKVLEGLQKNNDRFKDFLYKEAMLNPTNIRDKADAFEATIVKEFQKDKSLKTVSGFRSVLGKNFFYIAFPLSITEASCLQCHSTPDAAPKTMIDIYGDRNGFGWKLNTINGAQIVSIPANEVLQKARQSLVLVMGVVTLIFASAIYIANFWLKRYVVKPIKQVVRVTEAVSTGDLNAEFEKVSNDEIGSLVEAFTRMKLSLIMAIRRYERYRMGNGETSDK
jgi:methyl-accepting chemotaxis protein